MNRKYWLHGEVVAIAAFYLGAISVQSQNLFCVRAGATGAGNGSDWNNAYPSLPATLQRGATYYIADGSYSGYTFDDAESGSTLITVKKATVSDHGTGTGWSNGYGDGAANFGGISIQSGYWVIDGATRSSWTTGYGFTVSTGSTIQFGQNFTKSVTNVTLKYTQAKGNYPAADKTRVVQVIGPHDLITLSYCHFYDAGESVIHAKGIRRLTVDHCELSRNNDAGGTHSELIVIADAYEVTLRYNIFEQAKSTAAIATPTVGHPGCAGPILGNWYIYGNIFRGPYSSGNGNLYLFDTQLSGTLYVVNNTFVGINNAWTGPAGGTSGCVVNYVAQNNLFYGVKQAIAPYASANTFTHNAYFDSPLLNSLYGTSAYTGTGNPVMDYPNDDFSVKSTVANAMDAGIAVSVSGHTFNLDMYGNPRGADGKWDRGAVEYRSGPDVTAPLISGVTAGNLTTNSATITFSTPESARSGVEFGLTAAYGATVTNATLSTSHGLQLNGLTPNTIYHYRIHATDAAGNHTNTADASFQTAQIPAPDTNAPVVSGLASGVIGSSSATVSFTTSEAARAGIQFGLSVGYGSSLTNSSLVTAHNFSLGGLSPNTVYHYRVSASDAAGNSSVSSDAVFQTTALDTVSPTVSLTAPSNGAVLSNTVSLNASATDNIAVAGVSFLLDGVGLGAEDTTVPYGIVWDTTTVANGTYLLAARVRDSSGNQTTSATISVTVVASSTPATLKVGDRIVVNSDPTLRVRSSAALAGTIVGEQLNGALGTIVAGPVTADGYTWWQIDYLSAPDGWSIEGSSTGKWLKLHTEDRPAPPSGLLVVGQ